MNPKDFKKLIETCVEGWNSPENAARIDACCNFDKQEIEEMGTDEYEDAILYGVVEAYEAWARETGAKPFDQLSPEEKGCVLDEGCNLTQYGSYTGDVTDPAVLKRFITKVTKPVTEGQDGWREVGGTWTKQDGPLTACVSRGSDGWEWAVYRGKDNEIGGADCVPDLERAKADAEALMGRVSYKSSSMDRVSYKSRLDR